MIASTKEIEKIVFKLIDNANALVLYFDINGTVSLCNKVIENITGRSREEIFGKNWSYILATQKDSLAGLQMLKAVVDDSISYKRPNNFEGIIIDREKQERIISWSITPIVKDSEALEGVLCIGNDITALKEREASLKKIDDTLNNIFSSIKEYALYVTNLDGNITYYGMGSEIMFGWQKNEIVFKHVGVLHNPEDVQSQLPKIFQQVRQCGQYETEIKLVKKDGGQLPVILSATKFLDEQENLKGYIFIAKDITERKELENQIFQSEKLAAIGKLAAGMAHEINNPLFVISGRVELLLAEKRLANKTRQELSIISTQAERIRKLVDQLLKFSRKKTPSLEVVNINDTIESVMPLLSYHKLPDYNIEIVKEFEKNLPLIKGDLNQLQEVFVNLFINAYQSMSEGGRLTIKTGNYLKRFVQVTISDTGGGIAAEDLKNIFLPFFSTKKNGTGLGLSICYNIIKAHNGSLDVESQSGKGTAFIIRLPFV